MGYKALPSTIHPSAQALEVAKQFFEPQLKSLGFGVDQIHTYDLQELQAALARIDDSLKKSESFKTIGFSMTIEAGTLGVVVVKDRKNSNFEIGITPFLLERKKLILEKIKDLKQNKAQVESLRDLVNQVDNE